MKTLLTTLFLSVVLASAACGGEEPKDPSTTPSPTPTEGPLRLLPMEVGWSWTYRSTDPESGAESAKTRTIEALEDIGDRKAGIQAYRMRVENDDGYSLSWHEDLGPAMGVVRHREETFTAGGVLERDEYYDAFKYRVDETPAHVATGATWSETYTETRIEPGMPEVVEEEIRDWVVEAAQESVTVPAGTFDALRVRRTSPAGGTDKTYWFVPGIGKVKEVEVGGKTLELVTWTEP